MGILGFDEAVQRLESREGQREIRELPEHLEPGEAVSELVLCRYQGGPGVLALTDRRVLFVYEGWSRETIVNLALDEVHNLGYEDEDGGGEIEILAEQPRGKVDHAFGDVIDAEGMRFVRAVRWALSRR